MQEVPAGGGANRQRCGVVAMVDGGAAQRAVCGSHHWHWVWRHKVAESSGDGEKLALCLCPSFIVTDVRGWRTDGPHGVRG